MRVVRLVVALSLIVASAGCTAKRLTDQHALLREHVIDLYENQVMDNLVRAYEQRVMVHLNYIEFGGETLTEGTVAGQIGDNDNENVVAKAGNALETIITPYDTDNLWFQASGKFSDKLNMKAAPLEAKRAAKVYREYLKFVDTPAHFCAGRILPDSVARSTARISWRGIRRDTVYYWVPTVAQGAFLNLVADTTTADITTREEPGALYATAENEPTETSPAVAEEYRSLHGVGAPTSESRNRCWRRSALDDQYPAR